MKLVLVACGTALATSTVVAKKIEQIAQENGIECQTIQARAVDVMKKYEELHPDAIVCTCQLEEEARSRQVQVVMFGHTHYPYLDEEEDLTVLNPGSLSYPRQPGRKPSYLVMQIDEQGKAHYEHRYLEKS